jgi:hypothetical protein
MTTNYFWTRAPESYDYLACTSVSLDDWRDAFGHGGWRLVKIEDNEHTHGFAVTQCDRYRSGCHAVVDAFDMAACERQGLIPMVRTVTVEATDEDTFNPNDLTSDRRDRGLRDPRRPGIDPKY